VTQSSDEFQNEKRTKKRGNYQDQENEYQQTNLNNGN
jgi:hypothetical protein